jgi:putative membrane protein
MPLLLLAALLIAAPIATAVRPGPANAHRGQPHPGAGRAEATEAGGAPAENDREAPRSWNDLARAWEFDPGVVIPILLSGALYLRGVWGGRGLRRGVRTREVACFAGGWAALAVALVSPLHPWGEALFSAHMIQHELLMLVAAPLLVLGSPLAPTLRALPHSWALALARASRSAPWTRLVQALRNPIVAWAVHGVVLWAWHAPALFDAAVRNEGLHALQHLSFLGSAAIFWWALLHGRGRAMAYGAAVLYLFTTAMHSGLLGALLTFSETPWYPAYAATSRFWGVSAVDDQQLGGLIMWVPACSLYVVVALALFARWMRASGEGVRRAEERAASGEP